MRARASATCCIWARFAAIVDIRRSDRGCAVAISMPTGRRTRSFGGAAGRGVVRRGAASVDQKGNAMVSAKARHRLRRGGSGRRRAGWRRRARAHRIEVLDGRAPSTTRICALEPGAPARSGGAFGLVTMGVADALQRRPRLRLRRRRRRQIRKHLPAATLLKEFGARIVNSPLARGRSSRCVALTAGRRRSARCSSTTSSRPASISW